MNETGKRIATAAIAAPVTIVSILYGDILYWLFCLIGMFMALFEWDSMVRTDRKNRLVLRVSGLLYILLCVASLIYLRGQEDGLALTIILFSGIWLSDIFAYICGRLLKGPRIAPQISPNKTWAGFIAAVVFPFIYLIMLEVTGLFNVHFLTACIAGFILGITSQFGDFVISMVKRHVGVKDTGNLLPGHGGLLDRVDSLILAAPVFVLLLRFLS